MAAKVRIIADTHVHLYPCFEISLALDNLLINLVGHDPDAVHAAFLVERHDCHFFSSLSMNVLNLNLSINTIPGQLNVLRLSKEDTTIYLFSGKQIITRERIEILALMMDQPIQDGLPAKQVVDQILKSGAIPVISWAPGKWFFHRKQVVKSLLTSYEPRALFLGDTTLRPTIWPEPGLMSWGRKSGFVTLAGSDPLPFPGEERFPGRLVVSFAGEFNPQHPEESMRALFGNPQTTFHHLGSRCGFLEVLYRVYQNHQSKKRAIHD